MDHYVHRLNDSRVNLFFGRAALVETVRRFVDAIGVLYDAVTEKGAEVVGFTDTKGYEFEVSAAVRDGQFVGLVLDQDNQSGKSEKRIAAWTSQIL